MKWPWKVTSWVVLWGSAIGARLTTLCISWMTALVKGRFFLSSMCTWRLPTTLLSSSRTWSGRWKAFVFMKKTSSHSVVRTAENVYWVSCGYLLTLYFWILGHEHKYPSQCSCRCVSATTKQIQNRYHKIFIVEVTVGNPRFLWVTTYQCIIQINLNRQLIIHYCNGA